MDLLEVSKKVAVDFTPDFERKTLKTTEWFLEGVFHVVESWWVIVCCGEYFVCRSYLKVASW